MKRLVALLLFCFTAGFSYAQPTGGLALGNQTFKDDSGQRISFELPQTWKFEGGIIENATGRKVGEFMPGTIPGCPYQSGIEYLQELRAGYPDDMGNPRFVGARTLVIGKITWTEGVRNIPAWDGKNNTGRWYSHSFFALLNKRCFVINFYSQQRQLPEEERFKGILASIKLL